MGLTPRSVHQSLAPAPVEGTWNAWVRFLVEILAAVGDRMLRPTQSALLKAGDHIQLIPPPDPRGRRHDHSADHRETRAVSKRIKFTPRRTAPRPLPGSPPGRRRTSSSRRAGAR